MYPQGKKWFYWKQKKDKLEERLKYIELKTKKLEEEKKDLTDNERNKQSIWWWSNYWVFW